MMDETTYVNEVRERLHHLMRTQTRIIKILEEMAVNYSNLEKKTRRLEIALQARRH
jgi:hypothetical protein